MDSFNKVVSFVLGLVVVLVFLSVVTGKLNLKGKSASTSVITPTPVQKSNDGLFGFFNKPTPTSTPIPTQKPLPISAINVGGNNVYNQYGPTSPSYPKSIPSTGLPTLFIPTLLSGLVGGSFLRRSGKKKD